MFWIQLLLLLLLLTTSMLERLNRHLIPICNEFNMNYDCIKLRLLPPFTLFLFMKILLILWAAQIRIVYSAIIDGSMLFFLMIMFELCEYDYNDTIK